MNGYLKNPEATAEAFRGGWFHTGDLAVMHEDGYVEIQDRAKDIIISGGENISSIEIEGALYRHPAVLEAAVVARPDEKWGETPCAFVTLKDGASATAEELIAHCRKLLAGFKAPSSTSCPRPRPARCRRRSCARRRRRSADTACRGGDRNSCDNRSLAGRAGAA
jgi:fatty-acyl-CoA synthase